MSPLASNINLVLGFLFQLSEKVESVIKGGSISFLQLPGFIGIFEAAGPAIGALKSIPSELSALSDADLAAVRSYVQAQLPSLVENAEIDAAINNGLALAQQLYDFVISLRKPAVAPVAPAS